MLATVTLRRSSRFVGNDARHKSCSFHALIMRNTETLLKRTALIAAAAFVAQAHPGKFKVEVAIAVDQDTKPATTFATSVPKRYAFFKSTGTHERRQIAWSLDRCGRWRCCPAANTKIDEYTLTGDELATSVKFTIKAGKAQCDEDDESSDDSSGE